MNGRSAPTPVALSSRARALLALLLLPLLACEGLGGGDEAPSLSLRILDPAPGQVGATVTAELVLTGKVEDARVKLYAPNMPSTPLQTGQCLESCTVHFTPPSGTVEVQAFLIPRLEDGTPGPEMASERLSVQVDSRPLVSLLMPTFDGSLKVLFLKDVLPTSVNADTVKVTRRVQTDFGASSYTEEPVAVTTSLEGRTLIVRGPWGSPALLTLKIDGVRDAPGNRNVATYTAPRTFLTNGPDLRLSVNAGPPDRFRWDAQGRLHHLAQNATWRLQGSNWVEVATWQYHSEQDFDLEPGGHPVVVHSLLRNVYVPETGTTRLYRDVQVQRWNGTAMEDLGGVLASSINQFIGMHLRVDPQGRPVVLVAMPESGGDELRLLRWSGTAWDTLSARLNTGSATRVLGAAGGDGGPVVVGWAEGSGSARRTFLRRVEPDGTLTALDSTSAQPDFALDLLTYGTGGQALAAAGLPGDVVGAQQVLRHGSEGWQSLGGPGTAASPEFIYALTSDPEGAPVIFTLRRNQSGSSVNDPGDPFSGSSPNIFTTLSGYRHDGQRWAPLAGATHHLLETQQAPWTSNAPADFNRGDATGVMGARYLSDGTLWTLKLRSRLDFSTSPPTARTYLLRAHHAP